MRNIVKLTLAALVLWALPLLAQQPIPGATAIQQFPPLYACDQTATATGAANTAVTASIPAQNGKYIYVCHVDIFEVANAAVTGAAGPAPIFTTTNLATNLVWWGDNATQGTGWQKQITNNTWNTIPLKTAAPGTAFTVVTSAGQSTQSDRINISAFYGS